jgi:probable HAF family extracellular repeat protein
MGITALRRRKGLALGIAGGLLASGWLLGTRSTAPIAVATSLPQTESPHAASIRAIETPPGAQIAIPTGINNQGQASLVAIMKDDRIRGFFWNNGKATDVGTLGGVDAVANGVNDSGQVVGIATLKGEEEAHAFVWERGKIRNLGSLGGEFSAANAINNRGVAVGTSLTKEYDVFAAVWQGGKIGKIGALPGMEMSAGTGVNENGDAVGVSASEESIKGFYYRGGTLRQLSGLKDSDCVAVGVNNDGMVLGNSLTEQSEDAAIHAVLWNGGKVQDLGTLPGYSFSFGAGVNNRGDAVGFVFEPGERNFSAEATLLSFSHPTVQDYLRFWYLPPATRSALQESSARALNMMRGFPKLFLDPNPANYGWYSEAIKGEMPKAVAWSKGKILDLNSLLPRNSGWHLLTADGVNDKGQVVGMGVYKNRLCAYLLTP